MQVSVVTVGFFVVGMTAFDLLTQSHNDCDGPKIISDALYHTKLCRQMTLQLYPHTVTLLSFLSFNVFGRMHNRVSKVIVCCRVLACDSGPGWELANFTDSSSDSDSSQNGLIRPTPTPVSTPTPQHCVLAAYASAPGTVRSTASLPRMSDSQSIHVCQFVYLCGRPSTLNAHMGTRNGSLCSHKSSHGTRNYLYCFSTHDTFPHCNMRIRRSTKKAVFLHDRMTKYVKSAV